MRITFLFGEGIEYLRFAKPSFINNRNIEMV